MKAFPHEGWNGHESIAYEGMDLRDYFAAKAMQGFNANPESNQQWTDQQVAEWSYRQADSMMKAREQ